MASYAAIASKPGVSVDVSASAPLAKVDPSVLTATTSEEIAHWMSLMSEVVTPPPDQLVRLMEVLRREMEMPTGVSGFRGQQGGGGGAPSSQRNFGGSSGQSGQSGQSGSSGPSTNWRNGFNSSSRFGSASASASASSSSSSAFDTRGGSRGFHESSSQATDSSPRSRPSVGRYQSRFKSSDNLEDKILNTVIGNKLNAFTPLTYNDTRDFIYQIIDSGEKEFTRDFIEKVFVKAVVEDLYCALFAKLIAEIAHRYPVIYEEMNKYHKEFLKIFDNVKEDSEAEYGDLVKEKQYRMGYGQFIAELAGLNALDKNHLITMIYMIIDKIYSCSADENKVKTVEEFIDCIVRLTKGLQTRSPTFFKNVKGELVEMLLERVDILIARSTPRPSFSNKARFGLMDLRDIITK